MTAPDLSRQVEIAGDKIRVYDHPTSGKTVPSVTTVINFLAKPGVAFAGYRECGKFVAANLDTLNALKGDPSAIVDLVRFAPTRAWSNSAVRGDVVHDWIDRRIKSGGAEPTDEEIASAAWQVKGTWEAFKAVEAEYGIEWLHSETTVWSETHGYAGTLDFVARIGGAIVLGDSKTGKNLWPEVGMQLGALHEADYAFDDRGHQFELPKAERFAALHLRPRSGLLQPVDRVDECFEGFLGLLAVANWKVTHSQSVLGQYAPKIETRSYNISKQEEGQS
jgi:hypothetical protein